HRHRTAARAVARDRARARAHRRSTDWCGARGIAHRSSTGAHRGLASRAVRPCGFCTLLGGSLMPERTVQIVNKNGIHARPAAEIDKLAAKCKSDITVVRDDLEVNGKSIMGVMMLAAECGSTVELRAEGPDASEALEALTNLIAGKFGES